MTGFSNVAELVRANEAGRTHTCSFRKVPSQATVAGWWADLSMASGNPVPNYYAAAPLVAATLDGFEGIFHGDDKEPAHKFLTHLGMMADNVAFAGRFILLDYLLYYPFIDGDSTDEQTMDNTVTLPRFTDGERVEVIAVAVAPSTGGGVFSFNYINQDGDPAVSPSQACSTTAANIATLVTTQQAVAGAPGGPFLMLANGDTGIRSITSVTFSVVNGGLIALVLVKAITDLAIREASAMAEMSMVNDRPGPARVRDGAYLNLIVNSPASIATRQLAGYATFAWSD